MLRNYYESGISTTRTHERKAKLEVRHWTVRYSILWLNEELAGEIDQADEFKERHIPQAC